MITTAASMPSDGDAPRTYHRPRWYGVADCAARAHVHPATVSAALSSWARSGVGLRYLVRRGSVVRVRPADCRAWILAGCPTGPNRDPAPRGRRR